MLLSTTKYTFLEVRYLLIKLSYLSSYRLRGNIGGAGEVYSMTGDVVNRWGAADTSCQPLTFSLNENLSLQIPTKAEAFINFTVGQLHARITVTNKLKEVFQYSFLEDIINSG